MISSLIMLAIFGLSIAIVYFLGWLCCEYIGYRKLLKQEAKIRQHLEEYPLSNYSDLDNSNYYDDLGNSEDYDGFVDALLDEYYHHNCLQKVYDNMLEEAMIQDIENDNLEDEYYHHDEDYYRTHSAFVIIEKDENESINQ